MTPIQKPMIDYSNLHLKLGHLLASVLLSLTPFTMTTTRLSTFLFSSSFVVALIVMFVMFVMFVIAAFSGLTGSGLYAKAYGRTSYHRQILQQRTQLHAPEGHKPVWALFWERLGVLQVIDILRSLNLEQLRTPEAESSAKAP
jgi:hypothetical protein